MDDTFAMLSSEKLQMPQLGVSGESEVLVDTDLLRASPMLQPEALQLLPGPRDTPIGSIDLPTSTQQPSAFALTPENTHLAQQTQQDARGALERGQSLGQQIERGMQESLEAAPNNTVGAQGSGSKRSRQQAVADTQPAPAKRTSVRLRRKTTNHSLDDNKPSPSEAKDASPPSDPGPATRHASGMTLQQTNITPQQPHVQSNVSCADGDTSHLMTVAMGNSRENSSAHLNQVGPHTSQNGMPVPAITEPELKHAYCSSVQALKDYITVSNLLSYDITGKNLPEKITADLKMLIHQISKVCLQAIKPDTPYVVNVISKDFSQATAIDWELDKSHWMNVISRLQLTDQQAMNILRARMTHVEKLMAVYNERAMVAKQAASVAASMQAGQANILNGRLVGSPEEAGGAMSVLLRHGYLYCARNVVNMHKCVEMLQETISREQRVVMELFLKVVYQVLSPVQAAIFVVESFPYHCDVLALANVLNMAYKKGDNNANVPNPNASMSLPGWNGQVKSSPSLQYPAGYGNLMPGPMGPRSQINPAGSLSYPNPSGNLNGPQPDNFSKLRNFLDATTSNPVGQDGMSAQAGQLNPHGSLNPGLPGSGAFHSPGNGQMSSMGSGALMMQNGNGYMNGIGQRNMQSPVMLPDVNQGVLSANGNGNLVGMSSQQFKQLPQSQPQPQPQQGNELRPSSSEGVLLNSLLASQHSSGNFNGIVGKLSSELPGGDILSGIGPINLNSEGDKQAMANGLGSNIGNGTARSRPNGPNSSTPGPGGASGSDTFSGSPNVGQLPQRAGSMQTPQMNDNMVPVMQGMQQERWLSGNGGPNGYPMSTNGGSLTIPDMSAGGRTSMPGMPGSSMMLPNNSVSASGLVPSRLTPDMMQAGYRAFPQGSRGTPQLTSNSPAGRGVVGMPLQDGKQQMYPMIGSDGRLLSGSVMLDSKGMWVTDSRNGEVMGPPMQPPGGPGRMPVMNGMLQPANGLMRGSSGGGSMMLQGSPSGGMINSSGGMITGSMRPMHSMSPHASGDMSAFWPGMNSQQAPGHPQMMHQGNLNSMNMPMQGRLMQGQQQMMQMNGLGQHSMSNGLPPGMVMIGKGSMGGMQQGGSIPMMMNANSKEGELGVNNSGATPAEHAASLQDNGQVS